jgi:hypothetical protein
MRRKCQVYKHDGTQCEEPAVDFGEVKFEGGSDWWPDISVDPVRIWMCAQHWDEHQKTKKGKWS